MEVVAADKPIPPRRALKRSASTASLPTPPRTRRRRDKARDRSRANNISDDSENEGAGSSELSSSDDERDDELPQIRHKANKKRRLTLSKGDGGDEEAFWLAPADKKSGTHPVRQTNASDEEDGSIDVDLDADDSSVPLVYRKISRSRSQSSASTGLASPPPSHRKTQSQTQVPITPPAGDTPGPSTVGGRIIKSSPGSIPVTPKKQTGYATRARTKVFRTPERPVVSDSPDNPFYVAPATPSPGTESESPRISSASPQTPKVSDSWIEKPTVTYVFRGVRKEYQNPLFNHAKNKPLTPPRNSKLPPDHPDYSPDMTCKPTILFPAAHAAAKRSQQAHPAANTTKSEATNQGVLRRSPRRRRLGVGDSDDESRKGTIGTEFDGEEKKRGEGFIRPRKLDFGAVKAKSSSVNKLGSTRSGATKGKEKEHGRTVTRNAVARTRVKTATNPRVGAAQTKAKELR